jgi:hypothetical protein
VYTRTRPALASSSATAVLDRRKLRLLYAALTPQKCAATPLTVDLDYLDFVVCLQAFCGLWFTVSEGTQHRIWLRRGARRASRRWPERSTVSAPASAELYAVSSGDLDTDLGGRLTGISTAGNVRRVRSLAA